jgi:hypothetical protein
VRYRSTCISHQQYSRIEKVRYGFSAQLFDLYLTEQIWTVSSRKTLDIIVKVVLLKEFLKQKTERGKPVIYE